MPEFPAAAEILAAVDIVSELAQDRWSEAVGSMLRALKAEAEQQRNEDREIGRAMYRELDKFDWQNSEAAGAHIRRAVALAGGRIVFEVPVEPPAATGPDCVICGDPVHSDVIFHNGNIGPGHMACVNGEARRRAADAAPDAHELAHPATDSQGATA